MSAKWFVLAMTVALGTLSGALEAGAVPASIGTSLDWNEAPIVKVDYYYPHYYRYRHDPHYGSLEDTPLALLTIPGRILGTVFGGLAGDPYANPDFADPFYAPYRYNRYAYYGGRYWDRDDRYSRYGRDYSSYEWPRYRRAYSYSYSYRERADYYGRPYGWDYGRRPYSPDYGRHAVRDWDYGRPSAYAEASYDDSYGEDRSYRSIYDSRWSYRDYGAAYSRGGEAACEREFRSFDPETGTYVNGYGERVFCPYLHP